MMSYLWDIKENEEVIKKFEKIVSDCNPDDHWLFDRVYEDDGDWEYKFERMNDWLSGFITALYYKKELEGCTVEYNF